MKGNIVCNYKVRVEVCGWCRGRGTVNKEILKKYHHEIGLSCQDLLNHIREIVNRGKCSCPNCCGSGSIEVWE